MGWLGPGDWRTSRFVSAGGIMGRSVDDEKWDLWQARMKRLRRHGRRSGTVFRQVVLSDAAFGQRPGRLAEMSARRSGKAPCPGKGKRFVQRRAIRPIGAGPSARGACLTTRTSPIPASTRGRTMGWTTAAAGRSTSPTSATPLPTAPPAPGAASGFDLQAEVGGVAIRILFCKKERSGFWQFTPHRRRAKGFCCSSGRLIRNSASEVRAVNGAFGAWADARRIACPYRPAE